jgi:DNA-binding CsgD family transcriptional regulator
LGEPNKLVADALECSIATVEAHVTTILRKARVGNRTALVAKFWSASTASTA